MERIKEFWSILDNSFYITQTATKLKQSEVAVFVQLCLLHWGRLNISAIKSFWELFHFEFRHFFACFFRQGCCGINLNPRNMLLMPLDCVFVFFYHTVRHGFCASNYCLCDWFQNRMKNIHDRVNQSTWWQQSQAPLMKPQLETQSNYVWCYYGVCSLLVKTLPIISWSESFQGIMTIVTCNLVVADDKKCKLATKWRALEDCETLGWFVASV